MKTKTRTGKIARLPRQIREELNRRLQDGQPGKRLVAWLNALPKVQKVMAAEFGGKGINETNLTAWKQGGYQDWLEQQETLEAAERLAEDGAELRELAGGDLSDRVAAWLLARQLVAFRQLQAECDGEAGWKRLRELCDDVVKLRRGDLRAQKLALEREKWEHKKADEEKAMPQAEPRLSREECQRRIAEIYGRPWPPEKYQVPGGECQDDKKEPPGEVSGEEPQMEEEQNGEHSTPNIQFPTPNEKADDQGTENGGARMEDGDRQDACPTRAELGPCGRLPLTAERRRPTSDELEIMGRDNVPRRTIPTILEKEE